MPAVAGSRSRAETMISVRPPLSSLSARSVSALIRSVALPDDRELDGWGGGGGGGGGGGVTVRVVGPLPGNGEGTGMVCGWFDAGALLPVLDPPLFELLDPMPFDASMPIA